MVLVPLPEHFGETREALHAVAEHVLAAARYRAEKHIGLAPTPGGFGTPRYGQGEVARVDGVDIVYEGVDAQRRGPITTLVAAAKCVGVPVGLPEGIYRPATHLPYDELLHLDPDAAVALAAWIALGGSLLDDLGATYAAHAPTGVTLWPEHFDLSRDLGAEDAGTRATYGASPGDAEISEPYLYASPWDPARKTGVFAARSFGAAVRYGELAADPVPAGRAFFTECASLLLNA